MSGCCRGLPAKVCWARPYGCSNEPPARSSLVGGVQKAMADPKTTAFASWSSATNCYSCPKCSCGAVPDWKREAPLRCTGCKAPLASREGLGS